MPSMDVTFCADGNKCKQRHKCFRWTGKELMDKEGMYWYADFHLDWKGSGKQTCDNFIQG